MGLTVPTGASRVEEDRLDGASEDALPRCSDSEPLIRMTLNITQAIPCTTFCMMPRWYRTPISEAKKMMVGRTWKANMKPRLDGSARGPKMNAAPSREKPIRFPVTGKQEGDGDQYGQPEKTEGDGAQHAVCSRTFCSGAQYTGP